MIYDLVCVAAFAALVLPVASVATNAGFDIAHRARGRTQRAADNAYARRHLTPDFATFVKTLGFEPWQRLMIHDPWPAGTVQNPADPSPRPRRSNYRDTINAAWGDRGRWA